MKKIKFEKVSAKLTKEEMSTLKGGYKTGDTLGGDTYTGEVWSNGDIVYNGTDLYANGTKPR